jgi:hypothetical protein
MAAELIPPSGSSARILPSDEARHIAYIVVSFQTPAGGWSKNLNLTDHIRKQRRMAAGLAPGGGYHDAITFNDGAVTETLELLEPFVPASARARASVERGIETILATQISENGKRTVWAQQHDALNLQPVAGRNYEPAAPCAGPIWARYYEIGRARRVCRVERGAPLISGWLVDVIDHEHLHTFFPRLQPQAKLVLNG